MKLANFLSISELNRNELEWVLKLSDNLAGERRKAREVGKTLSHNRLSGHSIAAIFEKPSTRTRCSLSVAGFEEGANVMNLSPGEVHLGEKESLPDTARVLSQYFSAIAWRGHHHESVVSLAKHASVPVINLLSDTHHPSQALADLLTVEQEFGSVKGLKIVFLGDAGNNVSRSMCEAASILGHEVVLSGPEESLRDSMNFVACGVSREPDPLKAVRGAHVLYTDVWTSMGFEDRKEGVGSFEPYSVDASLFAATGRDDTIFLHCLPANRGQEVTDEVMDSNRSRVFVQAENRLHTLKAILLACSGALINS